MINLLPYLDILVLWVCIAACTLRWVSISRDGESGQRAQCLIIIALGLVLLPLGRILLPALPLNIVPQVVWQLFNVSFHGASKAIILAMIILYFSGLLVRLLAAIQSQQTLRLALQRCKQAPMPLQNTCNLLALQYHLAAPAVLVSPLAGQYSGPFTVGLRVPVIVLPQSSLVWSHSRLERVLVHELAHIARQDWFYARALDGIAMLMWFVPGVARLQDRFYWFSELNADDAVLRHGDNRTDYADDMLALTVKNDVQACAAKSLKPVMPLFDGTYGYERIAAVLDGSRPLGRLPMRPVRVLSMVCFSIVLWGSLSLFSLAAAPVPKTSESSGWHIYPWPGLAEPARSQNADDALIPTERLTDIAALQQSALRDLAIGRYEIPQDFRYKDAKDSAIFSRTMTSRTTASRTISSSTTASRTIPSSTTAAPSSSENVNSANTALKQEISANVLASVAPSFQAVTLAPFVEVKGFVATRSAMPVYPRRAQRKRIEGQVIAQFDVSPAGQATNIRIAMASPEDVFEPAVIKAIQASRFTPARVNGKPVATKHATQTFTFKLTEDAPHKLKQPQPALHTIKTASSQ